ncbi:hypothetical protein ACOME3_000191 [Neoechinorhynchus agilis]
MEITFSMNDISRQDDFHFPECQTLGHWDQKCSSISAICEFGDQNHHSSNRKKESRHCANCCLYGHCAFSKTWKLFKQYLVWAQQYQLKKFAPRNRMEKPAIKQSR